MRRPHLAVVAFLILAIGVAVAIGLEHHDSGKESHDIARLAKHDAAVLCAGLNQVRGEAQAFVVKLAPHTPVPKGAGAPLTATIEHSNAVKAKVRAEARESFKIVRCP